MIREQLIADLAEAVAAETAPPAEPPTLIEFARTLTVRKERRKIPLAPERHPAQYFCLAAIDAALAGRSPYRRFVIVKPTQDGGTITTQSIPHLYVAGELGDPVVAGLPDMRLAGIQWRDKTLALVLDSARETWLPLEGPGSERAGNPVQVKLNGRGDLYYFGAGAANEAGQAMVTARVLGRDEFDSMDPHNAELMTGRLDSYGTSALIIDTSTIKLDAQSPILDALEASTNGHLEFACPSCGRWTWWRWKHVDADWSSARAAQQSVRLKCPHCPCALDDVQRRRDLITLGNARLVMQGQHVDERGQVVGAPPDVLDWGLLWTAVDSPLTSLPALAVKYHAALVALRDGQHAPMRRFSRDRDCSPYAEAIVDTEISAAALARQSGRSDYQKRQVPAWVKHLTIAQDVQEDRHYWLVLGFDGEWRQAAVIDWGYESLVERDAASGRPLRAATVDDRRAVLQALHAMAEDGWQVVGGGARLVPVRRGIDVGYKAAEVLPWIAEHRQWVPCKGVGRDQANRMDKTAIRLGKSLLPEELAKRLLGWVDVRQPDTMPMPLVNVNGHEVRLALQTGLMRAPGEAGACWLPAGMKANDIIPLHLSAEVWTEEKKDGVGTGKWYWREVRKNNHLLDAATYAFALGRYQYEVQKWTTATVVATEMNDSEPAESELANERLSERRFSRLRR